MENVHHSEDLEVFTKSLLAAAHLVAAGYELLRVVAPRSAADSPRFGFSPAARPAIERFYACRDEVIAKLPADSPLRNQFPAARLRGAR